MPVNQQHYAHFMVSGIPSTNTVQRLKKKSSSIAIVKNTGASCDKNVHLHAELDNYNERPKMHEIKEKY